MNFLEQKLKTMIDESIRDMPKFGLRDAAKVGLAIGNDLLVGLSKKRIKQVKRTKLGSALKRGNVERNPKQEAERRAESKARRGRVQQAEIKARQEEQDRLY